MEETEESNLRLLRDCLSDPLISQSQAPTKPKKSRNKAGRKTAIKSVVQEKEEGSDAEELADFIDVRHPFILLLLSNSKFDIPPRVAVVTIPSI
jgi:hypothetical protein